MAWNLPHLSQNCESQNFSVVNLWRKCKTFWNVFKDSDLKYKKVKIVVLTFIYCVYKSRNRNLKVSTILYTHPKDQKIYIFYWLSNNLEVFQRFLLHFRNLFQKKMFLFLERHHDYFYLTHTSCRNKAILPA